MDGERCVTRASSCRASSVCPDLRRSSSDMGLRSRDLEALGGCAVGVEGFEVLDSFSLRPLRRDVCDLEKLE
jgi:hypothetical protein